MNTENSLYERIYAQVDLIPPGKVASYSQIGRLVGACSGRVVGFALAALPQSRYEEVPWQRVINMQGRISPHGFGGLLQRQLLSDEGIVFAPDGSIPLQEYQWQEGLPSGEQKERSPYRKKRS